MRIVMNRMSLIILAAILAASLLLAGCGSQDNKAVNSESGKSKVNIGVIQIIEHPSLDAARQGFLDALAENGYKEGDNLNVNYNNAQDFA